MFALLVAWVCGAAYAGISVMVLPFQNNASEPEYAPLGLGLQSMITSDLAYSDDLVVVERSRLQEVLAELEFQQSKYVDPATAVKIGKAVGASHYVNGSFTVVAGSMRLDARLIDIATEKVVAQADLTGEKDAFFELEKEVVKKFLAGIGAVLTPKERADIGRVQTADLGAMVKYSGGLQLYDAARYDEAIRILDEVAAADPNFTLASLTTAEIRKAAQDAALRAQAARVAAAEQKFVAHKAEAERDAVLAAELQQVAVDPARPWQDRATANLILVQLGQINQVFGELKDASDEFALERAGEQAYQAFWSELQAQTSPKWYPVLDQPSGLSSDVDVETVVAKYRKYWFESTNANNVLSSCAIMMQRMDVKEEYAKLWVPYNKRLDLARQLLVESKGCFPKYAERMRDLAGLYRDVGQFGAASAIMDALAKESTDPTFLESAAALLKDIAADQEGLEKFPAGSAAREALLPVRPINSNGGSVGFDEDLAKTLLREPDKVAWHLTYKVRNVFPFWGPLFVNGVPAWSASRRGMFEAQTGARTAADETRSIRFYRDLRRFDAPTGSNMNMQPQAEWPLLFVLGGAPRGNGITKVTVDYRPAADWYPRQFPTKPEGWAPLTDRPTAGILFGLREIATKPVCDPLDKTKMTPIPTTGYAAVIQKGQLVLAEVKEVWPEPDRCGMSTTEELRGLALGAPLASKPITKPNAEIVLEVKGSTVTATAAGVKVTATLKSAPTGFVAMYADGMGYVELRDPALQ